MKFSLLIQQQEDQFLALQSPDTKPKRILEKLEDFLLAPCAAGAFYKEIDDGMTPMVHTNPQGVIPFQRGRRHQYQVWVPPMVDQRFEDVDVANLRCE